MIDFEKPTVPSLLPYVQEYCNDHPGGGVLHIVLDDYNIEDSHLEWCRAHAREHDDVIGEALTLALMNMSKTQRLKLAHKVDCYPSRRHNPMT